MTHTLTKMPYAQAKVHTYDGDKVVKLISQKTEVATIVDGWLQIHGLYSRTTRRHISAFVEEYAIVKYEFAKSLYNDKYEYNIYTGEVRKVA